MTGAYVTESPAERVISQVRELASPSARIDIGYH